MKLQRGMGLRAGHAPLSHLKFAANHPCAMWGSQQAILCSHRHQQPIGALCSVSSAQGLLRLKLKRGVLWMEITWKTQGWPVKQLLWVSGGLRAHPAITSRATGQQQPGTIPRAVIMCWHCRSCHQDPTLTPRQGRCSEGWGQLLNQGLAADTSFSGLSQTPHTTKWWVYPLIPWLAFKCFFPFFSIPSPFFFSEFPFSMCYFPAFPVFSSIFLSETFPPFSSLLFYWFAFSCQTGWEGKKLQVCFISEGATIWEMPKDKPGTCTIPETTFSLEN